MKKLLLPLPLMTVLMLSACTGGLPKCDSKEAKNLVQQIINQRSAFLGEFVELNTVEETAFNKDAEIRVCTAELVTTKATEEIDYSIKWRNKDKNEFWLEIN